VSSIAPWLAGRLQPDLDLDRPALAALAAEIGAEESLWRSLVRHDAVERQYQQLYRDPNIDVWLICWTAAQGTGYHDHDRSSGSVYVCEGSLMEDSFQREPDGWIREHSRRHDAGSSFDFDASYIHGVRHTGEEPATSIHVYSPALWRMGHYEPNEQGVMCRVSMTYADELLGSAEA
jgi:predicted metal-dependent enzyme (double-stranded beta helix superfamily)